MGWTDWLHTGNLRLGMLIVKQVSPSVKRENAGERQSGSIVEKRSGPGRTSIAVASSLEP